MKIIAWIVLFFNILFTLKIIPNVFDGETKIHRISSFVVCLITIANWTLSIYVLRL
ncbi:hypothetical protein [Clostridium sp. 1001271B_151109_B4]|uniref:hypothetical protein n=1 Tax=Clostridium sp. 1001271B_151109_B4 TaxID=2787148 RepID=UPI0018AC2CFB|nr:hypothetical protein [Clostridium sp. 1001271B_151109_B4]